MTTRMEIGRTHFVHGPSKVMVTIEAIPLHPGPSEYSIAELPCHEARRIFLEGLAMCDAIEADYLRSLPATLAAAMDLHHDEVVRGLMRTGYRLVDPNFAPKAEQK